VTVDMILLRTVLRIKMFRQSCLQQRRECGPTDFIEIWAGCGNLTSAHVRLGLTCRRFDLAYSRKHACCTGTDLRLWIEEMTRLALEDLIWNGTQCSSFAMMSRSKSTRKPENQYYGDESTLIVRSGDEQAKVLSLVIVIALLTGVDWILEQPTSSVLPAMEPLQDVMAFSGGFKETMRLESFGAETRKRSRAKAADMQLDDKLTKGKFRGQP